MRTIIAGGSGLIGRALVSRLTALGHDVVVLTRRASGAPPQAGARLLEWDPEGDLGSWALELDGASAVINLAGAGIADRRWTAARKALIRSSRISSTRRLVDAIRRAASRPAVFVQASAVGFYGASTDDQERDESFPPGDDFLGQLSVAWEAEAHPAAALGCRLVILRGGPVLTAEGGIFARMRLPFLLFGGGPIASGRQYLSWIDRDDWIGMMIWALETPQASGAFNATSPNPVTNAEFSEALGRVLRRPSWLRTPRVGLRLLFGEMADDMLVNGQRVVPRRALEMGFTFAHPILRDALARAARPS